MNKPFVTEPRLDPLKDFRRAVTSLAMASVLDTDVQDAATRVYGKDHVATVTRAAAALTSTSNTGLVGNGVRVGPFLQSLRPVSAAAKLFSLGLRADLTGLGSITLPGGGADLFANAMWVDEGGAGPVFRGTLANVTLTPKKLLALSALTRELKDYSAESAEAVITDGLERSVARALDTKLFSTDAATGLAPAGVLNGLAPIAGVAGGGVNALSGDLKALIGAVVAAGGGAQLVLIASPVQAATASVLASNFNLPVIASPSLATGTVIVLDYGAFASGFADNVSIEVSDSAMVHLEDATPAELIASGGALNTGAAPVRSAFQADLRILKARLRAAWAMRAAAVAYTTTASW